MPVTEQGAAFDRYMLIPRVLVFVRRGETYLLLKGAPGKRLWANRYNGIGGHIEPGEAARGAALRELFEETGLSVDLQLCGTLLVDTGRNPGIGVYVFYGESKEGELRACPEGSLHWVRLDELPGLATVEDIPDLLRRIQGMKPGEAPFSARSYYDANDRLTVEFTE